MIAVDPAPRAPITIHRRIPMKALIASGALGLALAASLPAPAQAADAKPDRTCFWTRDIQGHSFGGPSTIYLRARSKEVIALETSNNCTTSHLQGDPLIFDLGSNSGPVCSPLDIDLKIGDPSHGPPTPCIIKSIRKLTPAEASAIPKKLQP
jgi:hypothetical protein